MLTGTTPDRSLKNTRRFWMGVTAALAVSLMLLAWRVSLYGVAVSSDSTAYLAGAANLVESGEYASAAGKPLTTWPPLLSCAIAVGTVWGMEPMRFIAGMNLCLLATLIIVLARWFQTALSSQVIAFLATILIALSPVLAREYSFALAEPLFIVLTTIALIALEKSRDGQWMWIVLASVFAALACLTRYVGVALALTVGIHVVCLTRQAMVGRITRAVVAVGLAAGPLAVWLTRNYLSAGNLTGVRPPSSVSFLSNSNSAFVAFVKWLIPLHSSDHHGLSVVVVAAAIGASIIIRRRLVGAPSANVEGRGAALPWSAIIFLPIYITMLIVSATLTNLDQVFDRMLTPAFVPWIMLVAFACDRYLAQCTSLAARRRGWNAVLGMLLFWFATMSRETIVTARQCALEGAGGFQIKSLHESSMLAALRAVPPQGVIYSNRGPAVAYHTGCSVGRTSRIDKGKLEKHLRARRPVNVVWFAPGAWNKYDLQLPLDIPDMELRVVESYADGAVFEIVATTHVVRNKSAVDGR